MDAELAGLTTAAASTIVKLLATQAWQATRDGVVALWHKAHPDKAARVGVDLDDNRAQLIEATSHGESGPIETALTDEWRGRLATLITVDPGLAAELRRLLNTQLTPALDQVTGGSAGAVRLSATATDHSTVIQAGGSVNITGSPSPRHG